MSVIEASYRLDLPEERWLLGVAESVCPLLDCGLGLVAWFYEAPEPGRCNTHGFLGLGPDRVWYDERRRSPTRGAAEPVSHRSALPMAFVSQVFASAQWRDLSAERTRGVLHVNGREVRVLNAADPTGFGCMLGAANPEGARRRPGAEAVWGRLAAHIAAGLRIRRRLGDGTQSSTAEAVIDPAGRIAHAVGAAKTPAGLLSLRRAALAADRARGSLRRSNPERAIAIWQGLVDGRWTLVDQFERDGRRYLVAHRNDPSVSNPRALTLRERQVLAYALLGHSTKLIAYELGLSLGATSAYLAGAMRKLGVRSRMQLATLGAKLSANVGLRPASGR